MLKLTSLSSKNLPVYAVATASLMGCLLWALLAGPDANWDLRNSTYFLGYRFWHGAGAQDMYPAQIQSWLNPVIPGFIVGMMQLLPPLVVTLILAAIHSLNAPLIYIITRQALRASAPKLQQMQSICTAVAATLLGLTGAVGLSEIGMTFSDNILSLLILTAVASLGHVALNAKSPTRWAWHWIGFSGLCAGVACGLKPTHMIFLPGLALCFAWIGKSLRDKIIGLVIFSSSIAAGLLISDGYWLWSLGQQTGNPLFPFYNKLFRSPWYDSVNFSDSRFKPATLVDGVLFIFRSALGTHPGTEIACADARLAVAMAMLPALFVKRPRGWAAALLAFFLSSIIMWLKFFGIQRYAISLEMLSGAVIVTLISLSLRPMIQPAIILVTTTLILMTTQAADWGHMKWPDSDAQDNWFQVTVPKDLLQEHQLFLLLGDEPTAYVTPFLPESSTFVRLGVISGPPSAQFWPQDATRSFRNIAGQPSV